MYPTSQCKAAEYIGVKHVVQQPDQDTLIEQSLTLYKNALNFGQNSLKALVHFPKTGGGVKFLRFIRQRVFVLSIVACAHVPSRNWCL